MGENESVGRLPGGWWGMTWSVGHNADMKTGPRRGRPPNTPLSQGATDC